MFEGKGIVSRIVAANIFEAVFVILILVAQEQNIVAVVARCAFWIGYRMQPFFRAPGMSAAAYMSLGIIAYMLFRLFSGV